MKILKIPNPPFPPCPPDLVSFSINHSRGKIFAQKTRIGNINPRIEIAQSTGLYKTRSDIFLSHTVSGKIGPQNLIH